MKAKWLGPTEWLEHGKVYEVLGVEGPFFRVVDDSGDDYIYIRLPVSRLSRNKGVA